MKRMLALILVMLMLAGLALAEEELTLHEGKYVIGRNIDAGSYVLTCTGTDGEEVKDAYAGLGQMMDAFGGNQGYGDLMNAFGGLYDNLSELTVEVLGDFGDVLESYTLKKGDMLNIELREGTALKISEGSCTLKAK